MDHPGDPFHEADDACCSLVQKPDLLRTADTELDLPGSHVLVDVFFLCVMEAHKGLYRFDDALRVAD